MLLSVPMCKEKIHFRENPLQYRWLSRLRCLHSSSIQRPYRVVKRATRGFHGQACTRNEEIPRVVDERYVDAYVLA